VDGIGGFDVGVKVKIKDEFKIRDEFENVRLFGIYLVKLMTQQGADKPSLKFKYC
jgi:hypothetical protein